MKGQNKIKTKKVLPRDRAPAAESDLVSRNMLYMCLLLTSAFVFCYLSVIGSLVERWMADDMYSYGFLIPFMSMYFVWMKRGEISQVPIAPSYVTGLPILLAGLSALLLFNARGIVIFQQVSILVTVSGMILLVFGSRIFRATLFPVLYLIFMIPVWRVFTDRFHYPMQRISGYVGAKLLGVVGIPVHLDGLFIHMPNVTLEVARACSGVNYLISIFALGIPLAYFYLKSWTRRVILLASALSVAIISNGLRVSIAGIFGNFGYRVHGPFDIFRTLFVSAVGFAALFVGLWLLSDKKSGDGTNNKEQVQRERSFDKDQKPGKGTYIPVLSAVIVLIIAGSLIHLGTFVDEPLPVPLERDFEHFPYRIGGWSGKSVEKEYDFYSEIGPDREMSRVYTNLQGQAVHVYVGYFEDQRDGEKEIKRNAIGEIVGPVEEISLGAVSGSSMKVNVSESSGGKENKLVFYWYDMNGRALTDSYLLKLNTFWESITRNRTNGSLIVITTEIGERDQVNGKRAAVENFIKVFRPHLTKFLGEERL